MKKKSKKKTRRSRGRSPKAVPGEAAGLTLLGSNTKYASPPPAVSPEQKGWDNRAERYELQAIARYLLTNEGRKKGLTFVHNVHRTAKCLYVPLGLTRIKRGLVGAAFYAHLPICGSVWVCAVCTSKVQSKRRKEIARAIEWAYKNGLKCIMVTLTFPHYIWHLLKDLVKKMRKALTKLRSGKKWQKLMKRFGFAGLIRSLELTYGINGWNLHTHELWLISKDADAVLLQYEIMKKWAQCCAAVGLLDPSDPAMVAAFSLRSVDVKDWVSSSEYLAKQDDMRRWGIDNELASSSTKNGKLSGRHPFALLKTATISNEDGRLFIEYAEAMTGKRQIFWSHGLKGKVGLKDLVDKALALDTRDPADSLAILSRDQWRMIIKENARAKILEIAESEGIDGIHAWFEERALAA